MQHEGSVAASAKASVDLPHPEGPQIMITCVGPRDPDTLTWARAFFGIEERSERGTYAIVRATSDVNRLACGDASQAIRSYFFVLFNFLIAIFLIYRFLKMSKPPMTPLVPAGGADSNRPSLQWWGSPNICRNPCQCLYLWAEPLICRARVGLVVSDIPPVEASEDVRGISQRIEEAWALETSGRGKSGCAGLCWLTACCFRGKDGSGVSFLRALVRSFGFKGWAFCLALIGASTFRITSTIMMGFLIRWFSAGGPWYEAVL
jgi:hypothetical protein